ncbi:hypothetical protein DSL64_10335 [Dyadobacter luteus]|uniref:2TM domain-containing protein n=1 Tax=Dyadobacter luteus TaxID=2259619 RepID=A0A3D8YD69_9BACT|nr:hypothetical protein DSL64_10335 [Dyadobacter luteus]
MNKKYLLIFSRKTRNMTHWLIIIIYAVLFSLADNYWLNMEREKSLFLMLSGVFVIHLCLNYYFLIYLPEKKK